MGLGQAIGHARGAADIFPSAPDQAVLADFIAGGHFERHLRRMRTEYRARLDALVDAAARHGDGLLRLRPVATGLHAVGEVDVADDTAVFREAMARGVEVMPLSNFYFDRRQTPVRGVMLGFAAVRPELIDAAMERLAAAIEAARRKPGSGRMRSS